MGSFASLRPATREDATGLALLTDIASHGFAFWLWLVELGHGGGDTPMERGRQKLRGDQGQGNWSDAVIAEAHGEIAGAAIGYGLGEGIRNIEADRPALKPIIDQARAVMSGVDVATLRDDDEFRARVEAGLAAVVGQLQTMVVDRGTREIEFDDEPAVAAVQS